MGNFISKAWDKLTGKKQADDANKVSQQAVDIQKQQYEEWKKRADEQSKIYDEFLPMIKEQWAKNYGQDSRFIDMFIDNIINGSPEQSEADSQWEKLKGMLQNPYGNIDTSQAESVQQQLVNDLTKPIEDSAEQQKLKGLAGNYIDQLTGANKTGEQQTADEWNSKYLNSLANSPDTAFNAGVSELARGMQTQNENIAKAMQNRGISSSGINMAALGSTAADRARGVSQLQGQRADRQVQNNAAGAQFANGLADKALNNYGTAVNTADYLAQQQEGRRQQQLAQQGTALDILNGAADRQMGITDKNIGYAQSAYDMANGRSSQAKNDILSLINLTSNKGQQDWNNIMSLLSGKGSLINGNAPTNYAQALNGLADSYSSAANGQSQLVGTVLGQAGNTNAGQKFINNTTQGIGNAISKIGNATGIASGISKILGLIGL